MIVFSTFASSAWIAAFIPASVRKSRPVLLGVFDSFLEGMEEVLPMSDNVDPGLSLYADTVCDLRGQYRRIQGWGGGIDIYRVHCYLLNGPP